MNTKHSKDNDINALREMERRMIDGMDMDGASSVRRTIYSIKLSHVDVDEQRNVLMCDGIKQDSSGEYYILAGSYVYSGVTGNLLFTVNCNLKYPFSTDILKRSINNHALIFDEAGVYELGGVDFTNGADVEFIQSVRY